MAGDFGEDPFRRLKSRVDAQSFAKLGDALLRLVGDKIGAGQIEVPFPIIAFALDCLLKTGERLIGQFLPLAQYP